jgi:hypothetical protein
LAAETADGEVQGVVTWVLNQLPNGKSSITVIQSGIPEKLEEKSLLGLAFALGRLQSFCLLSRVGTPALIKPPQATTPVRAVRGALGLIRRSIVNIVFVVILVAILFLIMSPLVNTHTLLGYVDSYLPSTLRAPSLNAFSGFTDEYNYLLRAIQNVQFLEHPSLQSASMVLFNVGVNHPFSAEFFMGFPFLLQNNSVNASRVAAEAASTASLETARKMTLVFGLTALGSLTFLALDEKYGLIAAVPGLFLLSSPGFVDFSLTLMLDIYLATFVLLALLSLYYYFVRDKRSGVWFAFVFLGLAIGAKTAIDPFILMLSIALTLLLGEKTLMRAAKTFFRGLILSIASFAVTSPVIIVRLPQHIADVLAPTPGGTRITFSLTTLFSQILVAPGYSIYYFNTWTNLLLYILVSIGIVVLAARIKNARHRAHTFLFIVALYCSLDFLLGGMIYNEGETYVSLIVYEAFLITLFFISIRGSGRWNLLPTAALLGLLSFNFLWYINKFPSLYYPTGRTNGLLPSAGMPMLSPELIGYTLLISTVMTLGFCGYAILAEYRHRGEIVPKA